MLLGIKREDFKARRPRIHGYSRALALLVSMFQITFAHNYNGNVVSHWTSLVAQMVKNPPAMWETWIQYLGWEDSPGERKGYPLQYSGVENSMDLFIIWGCPDSSVGKESTCNTGDPGSIPGLGGSAGE